MGRTGSVTERVVVGVDGSPSSRAALTAAAMLDLESACPLQAVHVLTRDAELFRDLLPPSGFTSWRARVDEELHRSWLAPARDLGRPIVGSIVEADRVADGLLEVAERIDAELIAIGLPARRSSLTQRLWGSLALDLMDTGTTSLLVVPGPRDSPRPSADQVAVRSNPVMPAPG